MSTHYLQQLDPKQQQAVAELIGMIKQRYPAASFDIGPAEDDPGVTHITAVVDLDDPDEVTDLVIDRMLDLQLEQDIPVYVIPIRTPQRVAALRQRTQERAVPAFPLPPASPR